MGALSITGSILILIGLILIFVPIIYFIIKAYINHIDFFTFIMASSIFYFIWMIGFAIVGLLFIFVGAYCIKSE